MLIFARSIIHMTLFYNQTISNNGHQLYLGDLSRFFDMNKEMKYKRYERGQENDNFS